MPTTTTATRKKSNEKINICFEFHSKPQKLIRIDNSGKLYVPALIRKLFRDYRFFVYVEDGKLVFDPVKIDDVFEEVEEE
ncbi:MAG: hypothetical protein XD40_0833 [Archaeoglobus fulgidus]|uniref:SpoVT-AbrB domain-containing protein n=1 Tax=Archaeoglobus fulgidus TaxID=2234 RepID=A0A101DED1_ARCFL|nr:hypothetical protein [Archaeoglobus fulgidus]KUJ94012.1 MAG: hypothetical protein XD40_0833 [Archaeoglobus fulgidus]KUK07042.1 MAG: hypothetical protein XD48_0754 [Archaeoglobus fulgidus]